jgi:hypothetical protein
MACGYNPAKTTTSSTGAGSGRGAMDIIEGVLKSGVTIAVILVVIGAIAALFMIVFGIATGIDEKIQD